MDGTITVTFTTDNDDTAQALADIVSSIAPYMVDNVTITAHVNDLEPV